MLLLLPAVVLLTSCQAQGAGTAPQGMTDVGKGSCEDKSCVPPGRDPDDTASLMQSKRVGSAQLTAATSSGSNAVEAPSIKEVCEAWGYLVTMADKLMNISLPECSTMMAVAKGTVESAETKLGPAVDQGFLQIFKSLLMEPDLPSAAQVAAACPEGKDCTPSAVIDIAKHRPFDKGYVTDPLWHRLGICYNAPYYYAEECIYAKVSPNAKNAIVTPKIVKGKTCEDLAYTRWPALYADPFYGWGNNVSLFVSDGLVEWIPFTYLIGACKACVSSLIMHGWGTQWRQDNPECSGPPMP